MAALNPVQSAGRQIAEVLRFRRDASRSEAAAGAVRLLDEVGIQQPQSAARRYAHQLSGGMRQRVMLAIALAGRPRVLIADEPTTALDVTVQAGILALVRKLVIEDRMALVWITHDIGVVAEVADSVAVMYGGGSSSGARSIRSSSSRRTRTRARSSSRRVRVGPPPRRRRSTQSRARRRSASSRQGARFIRAARWRSRSVRAGCPRRSRSDPGTRPPATSSGSRDDHDHRGPTARTA